MSKTPLVMRGVEYEEITPDLTTGSYYRYDMDRLMVLLNHRGKDFFISVTSQQKPSTVGRKGAIIGPDDGLELFLFRAKGGEQSRAWLGQRLSVRRFFGLDHVRARHSKSPDPLRDF